MFGHDLPRFLFRPVDDGGRSLLDPFLRARPAADHRIGVFRLHQVQRLRMAQEMARTLGADVAHRLDRNAFVVDRDARHRAQRAADRVIVDHHAFQAGAQKAGMHAGGFVDQIGAGIGDQRVVVALLIPRLGVRHLGIRHAGRNAAGQVVEPRHLGAGRHQQRLFAAAAGHGARPQIADEGPGAEDAGVTRADQIDIDEARQHFGGLLHHRARQSRGACRARLAGGQQQDRHALAHAQFQRPAGVFREFQGRHHETAGHADEGAVAPLLLAAGDGVQHLHADGQIFRRHPAGAHMFGRAADRRVTGVGVHIQRVGQVAADHGALEEMDVVQRIGHARHVVQVGGGRFAIGAGARVDHMNGGARGAEIDLVAPGFHVVAGIAGVERKPPRRPGDRVLHQCPREQ